MSRSVSTVSKLFIMVCMGLFLAAVTVIDAYAVSPSKVRAAAVAAGLDSLKNVPVPVPSNLANFIKPNEEARKAAVQLGKALFWDMQVGSDGQSCASCHFHAGADSRAKNQLGPGLKNTDPLLQNIFNPTGSGNAGGPNYTLTAADFPFHKLEDPEQESYLGRVVLFDTDDVASSMGVFNANFLGLSSIPGFPFDLGDVFADSIFNIGGINTRRVEPRNTPTVINAVFNFANFWDGRAHNEFNGVSVIGPLDEGAMVLVNEAGVLIEKKVRIPNSSLASQAVGPPLSDLEMSFFNRTFPDIGKKLLGLKPLALQKVHTKDSVLGEISDGRGLKTTYAQLIKKAFRSKYWDMPNGQGSDEELIAKNFSLFFGLAVQMYEATLVSDRTPFDRFMEGSNIALSEEQLQGLLVFINRGPGREPQLSFPDLFVGVGQGDCVGCHGGAEFTDASVASVSEEPIEVEETSVLLEDGTLAIAEETSFIDNGFANIGVRSTSEDLGRGAAIGFPLSFARQALEGLPFAPELPDDDCGVPPLAPCPIDDRVSVDGAFKIPGLRNVALTGPYFHNGGQATLSQVVEFYDRTGDFGDVNLENLERNMALINLSDADEEPLVEFLLALTDNRVANEQAPFDHPQLFVPNGHAGDNTVLDCIDDEQACDDFIVVPAIGKGGRGQAGLPPLGTFLGLEHLD